MSILQVSVICPIEIKFKVKIGWIFQLGHFGNHLSCDESVHLPQIKTQWVNRSHINGHVFPYGMLRFVKCSFVNCIEYINARRGLVQYFMGLSLSFSHVVKWHLFRVCEESVLMRFLKRYSVIVHLCMALMSRYAMYFQYCMYFCEFMHNIYK